MYLVFQALLNYLGFQIVKKEQSLMAGISSYGSQSQMPFWYLCLNEAAQSQVK